MKIHFFFVFIQNNFFSNLSPCFNEGEKLNGLQRGDARFVDVIHTNVGVLGIKESIGDADFFPNGYVFCFLILYL